MDKNVIMSAVDTLTAGKTDDQTLELIGAIKSELDTVGEDETAGLEEMKAEYEKKLAEVETSWREKYRNAFFHGVDEELEEKEETEPDEPDEPEKYEDLFD